MTDEREKWEIVWLKLEHEQAELEYQIQVLQAKLDFVSSLRANISDLRATLGKLPDDMLPLLEQEADETLLEAVRQKIAEQQGTHFQKIEKHFMNTQNKPITIAALETATGIPRASISAVLYRTHSDRFGNGESKGPSRAKVWWLMPPPPADPGTTFDDAGPELEPQPEPRGEEEIPF